MAKKINISSDGGTTYNTLPGNSGEISNELGEAEDTIFGQNFASTQVGLNGWSISTNALYKGFAGYVADLKQVSGAATTTTAEAMSLVSGKTYRIDAASKEIWDRSTAPVIKDDGTPVAAANIESIDYLFGRVTFISSYTVVGAITADIDYFGTAVISKGRSFTLTQSAAENDDTDFATAQANSGHMTFDLGLKTVSLEIGTIYDSTSAFLTALLARAELIIEINPDGGSDSVARGFFKLSSESQAGDVGALETESLTFNLSVPDQADMEYPFAWSFASGTTLNQAVVDCINAWQNATALKAQYLPNGTTGLVGDVIVTEISLTGGLEVMNEFSVNLRGSGAASAVT